MSSDQGPNRSIHLALPAARLWAAARFPYLASGLFGCGVVEAPGIGTVAVDQAWRLWLDPAVAADWTPAQFGSVLVHHVCHLLRAHGERALSAGVGSGESLRWVRCADAEINDDLVPAGLELPGAPVLPDQLGAEPGGLAERYYTLTLGSTPAGPQGEAAPGARLRGEDGSPGLPGGLVWVDGSSGEPSATSSPGQPGSGAPGAGQPGWSLDCGSGADGQDRPWERSAQAEGTPPGLSEWEADLLIRQVATECVRQGRDAGTVPAGLLRWASEVLQPAVDWRRVLGAEVRRAVADVSGNLDYSYRRPSRRASVSGAVVLPSMRRPIPEVAVVCDTSGSMSDELLARSLAEVEGLLRSLGMAREVRVLACDAAAAPAQRVTRARRLELVGGGGTNMGAGITAAAALKPRPAVVVVLTDGFTPWPHEAPRAMRVVVALLGEHAPEAPAWARSIRVPSSP